MRFWIASALTVLVASAQGNDLPNMKEDIRLLNQRVGELSLRLETLEGQNAALQKKAETSRDQQFVTLSQLNQTVAEINRSMKEAIASSKTDTLQHVAEQMEKLANQTNAALDSLAKQAGPSPKLAVAASQAGSAGTAEGVKEASFGTYTVQKGDSIGKIAQKTGARQADIISANKISDPSKLLVGQVLVIPGAK